MGNKQSAEEKAKRKEEKAARKREAKRLQKTNKDDSAPRPALNLSLAASRLEEADRSLDASLSRLRSATPATPSTRLADISSALSQVMFDNSQQPRSKKRVVVKTPEELIRENRRLQRQLLRTEERADKLESYINDLLVKVLECCPELLTDRPDEWMTTMERKKKRGKKPSHVS